MLIWGGPSSLGRVCSAIHVGGRSARCQYSDAGTSAPCIRLVWIDLGAAGALALEQTDPDPADEEMRGSQAGERDADEHRPFTVRLLLVHRPETRLDEQFVAGRSAISCPTGYGVTVATIREGDRC